MMMWLLLAQTITGLPAMLPGTDVKIVLPDLVTVLDAATVQNNRLVFDVPLEPGREIRLLISYAPEGELAVPTGYVGPQSDDILLQLGDARQLVSFRGWLADERGIELVLPGRNR
ncbi:MAG: hypothetical protein U5L04_11315 [Trueperaceae bacterium]|nr:hypothetical protein [Trueperaceae bacterium]